MLKRIIGFIAIIMILLLLGGCNMGKNHVESEDKNATLTEQQKQILKVEELPLDYSQLTNRQQAYLKSADKMLTYINEKYNSHGVHFSYLAYHEPELLDATTRILVIPDGDDPAIDTVTVKINADKDDGYEDTYLEYAARIVFEKYLDNHFAEILPEDKYKVYVSDTNIEGMSVDDLSGLDEHYINGKTVSSNIFVFISDDICKSGDELIVFANEFFTWMKGNDLYGSPKVVLCRDEGLPFFDPRDISETRKEYGIECAYGNVYENSEIDVEIHKY